MIADETARSGFLSDRVTGIGLDHLKGGLDQWAEKAAAILSGAQRSRIETLDGLTPNDIEPAPKTTDNASEGRNSH